MVSKLNSVTLSGLKCQKIDVEIAINRGLSTFQIVGLPDNVISESRERIKVAFKASSLDFPKGKIVVNLAPSDLKKVGSAFDLPIALGLISFIENIKLDLTKILVVGELSLDGSLRSVNGILAIVEYARENGYNSVFLPKQNEKEACLIDGIKIYAFTNLVEVYNHVIGKNMTQESEKTDLNTYINIDRKIDLDMVYIKGQEIAKRALMISAAGAHNIIMVGSPGSGKTLLSKSFRGILPSMSVEEMLEVTKIYSVSGLLQSDLPVITERPFRIVHHSASPASIIGGGRYAKPGEITLANRGAIMFDEFAEFPQSVLENLRQPMEDKMITVNRVYGSLNYPAQFILIACMNPCKCGYYGIKDSKKICTCTSSDVSRYQKKISGPIYDRFDLFVSIHPVEIVSLTENSDNFNNRMSSIEMRSIVESARNIQKERFKGLPISSNAEMGVKELTEFCMLSDDCLDILKKAIYNLGLTARSYHRVIKVARTIADIERKKEIEINHILEALQYRKSS